MKVFRGDYGNCRAETNVMNLSHGDFKSLAAKETTKM